MCNQNTHALYVIWCYLSLNTDEVQNMSKNKPVEKPNYHVHVCHQVMSKISAMFQMNSLKLQQELLTQIISLSNINRQSIW